MDIPSVAAMGERVRWWWVLRVSGGGGGWLVVVNGGVGLSDSGVFSGVNRSFS